MNVQLNESGVYETFVNLPSEIYSLVKLLLEFAAVLNKELNEKSELMPKVGMEKVRRQQLIDATLSSIEQHGLQGTTIVTISKLAGVSSGIISHYFWR